MKKEILIKSGLTFVLASAVITGSAYAFNGYNKANDPLETVTAFYQEWIDYQGSPLSDEVYKNHPALSDDFEKKIETIVAGFNNGSYDPVLLAQDKPDNIKMETSRNSDKTAIVIVTKTFGDTKKDIKVDLVKDGWKWQISDIRDPQIEQPLAINAELQSKVGDYIRENIADLSKERAVLGGTFYVTEIEFQAGSKVKVKYEDGHVEHVAISKYELLPDKSVRIESFEIINQ